MALDNPTILTVTQLNNQVKSQMETRFKNLWIQGEISSPKKYPSGHTYLTLKDSQSEISSVLFSGSGRNIDFQILHGLKVIAYGQPSIFIRRGQYQFIIENMYPAGKGELWLSFEQLKKRLVNEGLFDQKFKRNISLYPRRIGVLTSGSGSVLRDIINVINRRAPHINILVRPVQVQGEAAVDDIRRGLKEMNEHGGVDTIILGRGGGSMEDLWCFNDESLARDIFHSRLPVISAVGHETDFTISDFVADHRAPTPSAAAEIAVPKQTDLVQILDDFQNRMSARMEFSLKKLKSDVESIENRYGFRKPEVLIENLQQRINNIETQILQKMNNIIEKYHQQNLLLSERFKHVSPLRQISSYQDDLTIISKNLRQNYKQVLLSMVTQLEAISGRVVSLNPHKVLKRGYSIVYDETHSIITKSNEVEENSPITIQLSSGKLGAEIKDIEYE